MRVWLIAISALAVIALIYWNSPLGLAVAAAIFAFRYNFWRMLENLWHSQDE
jgi:hypothetical protein